MWIGPPHYVFPLTSERLLAADAPGLGTGNGGLLTYVWAGSGLT